MIDFNVINNLLLECLSASQNQESHSVVRWMHIVRIMIRNESPKSLSDCLNSIIDNRNLIRHGINLRKLNIFDNARVMIRCYRSPRCVFVSNHGFICAVWCGVIWFGRTVMDVKRESAQSPVLNVIFSWTLQSDSLPAVSLRTSPASVCLKRCEHIVAGRLEAWPKQFTEGGRKGPKGREGSGDKEKLRVHPDWWMCVSSAIDL